jgi:hypothetical protein
VKRLKLKINTKISLGKVLPGAVISVPCDDDNVPLDRYWRKRLIDSAIDNCITVLMDDEAEKKSSKGDSKIENKGDKL